MSGCGPSSWSARWCRDITSVRWASVRGCTCLFNPFNPCSTEAGVEQRGVQLCSIEHPLNGREWTAGRAAAWGEVVTAGLVRRHGTRCSAYCVGRPTQYAAPRLLREPRRPPDLDAPPRQPPGDAWSGAWDGLAKAGTKKPPPTGRGLRRRGQQDPRGTNNDHVTPHRLISC